jgi:hypothetical protein
MNRYVIITTRSWSDGAWSIDRKGTLKLISTVRLKSYNPEPSSSPNCSSRDQWFWARLLPQLQGTMAIPREQRRTSPELPPVTPGALSADPTRALGRGVYGERDRGTVSRQKAMDEAGHATRRGWAELELRRAIPRHRGPNSKRGWMIRDHEVRMGTWKGIIPAMRGQTIPSTSWGGNPWRATLDGERLSSIHDPNARQWPRTCNTPPGDLPGSHARPRDVPPVSCPCDSRNPTRWHSFPPLVPWRLGYRMQANYGSESPQREGAGSNIAADADSRGSTNELPRMRGILLTLRRARGRLQGGRPSWRAGPAWQQRGEADGADTWVPLAIVKSDRRVR